MSGLLNNINIHILLRSGYDGKVIENGFKDIPLLMLRSSHRFSNNSSYYI